jgi:2,4-dienoyl-CoA reductase-like NADH-dependent reductase (Old Yellow Enzyme family)
MGRTSSVPKEKPRNRKKKEALFQPIRIGNVEIRNRVAMTAMCTSYQDHLGHATEQSKAFINARAKGGVGLIIAGSVTVTKLHADRRGNSGYKMLDSFAHSGLADLAEQAHLFGSIIFMQISIGQGRQVYHKHTWVNPQLDVISASPVPLYIPPEMYPRKPVEYHKKMGLEYIKFCGDEALIPREATIAEIEETEDTVAASVPILKSLGYDGVEIHSSHGYFAFSFLSPRQNLRTDQYGGDLQQRMTFLRNLLRKSRQAVGKDFVIGVRLTLDEHIEGGLTLEHTKVIAKEVEREGANYICFSDGSHEAMKYYFPDESGTMIERAAEVRKLLSIPVITPSVDDPDQAEEVIRAGKADMIGMARGLLADPNWINKVAAGKRPVRCIRCNYGCMNRLKRGLGLRCVVNPELGFEQYIPEYRPSRPISRHLYLRR